MVNRRQSVRRLLILPPVRVSLGELNHELLFDLSEGGLAVYGRPAALGKRTFPIKFQLPGDDDPITTRGEIVWTARNRTGIRFVDFSDAARFHLKHWIATKLPPVPANADDYKIDWSKRVFKSRGTVRDEGWRPNYAGKVALVLGVSLVVFLLSLGLSRFHWKSGVKREPASDAALQPNATELSGQVLAAPPPAMGNAASKPSALTAPAAISKALFARGFVIQVGALTRQHNVDDLSSFLQQKGLPVIVSKSPDDSLYRVAVGPYPDLSAASHARNALKAQGINGFIKPWTRE